MRYIPITNYNIKQLEDFIKSIGTSSRSFRYYNSRDISIIKNHITTFLLYDNKFVGYGHLDQEDSKVWLGICVTQGSLGKGYGQKIMQRLIDSYNGTINLSVDQDNHRAIALYKLFNFLETHRSDHIIYMERQGNDNSN